MGKASNRKKQGRKVADLALVIGALKNADGALGISQAAQRGYYDLFGLTPSARARLGVTPEATEQRRSSKWSDLL